MQTNEQVIVQIENESRQTLEAEKENVHANGEEPKHSIASAGFIDVCQKTVAAIKEAGTYKIERVISTAQGMSINANGQEVINFCANNYLGLANHPRVVQAAKDTLDSHGYGLASVRFICGTQDIHKKLERKIADFHGMEDAIIYPSGFDANAGFFEAVLTPEDAVISDALNHASIIDGIRLCKAVRKRYLHMNMEDLEKQLIEVKDCRLKVIVTDGVFSMDGDIAPLPEIVALAKKYNAITFMDEAHATGVFGKNGRGTQEYFGMKGQIDVINSTLGKALGGGNGGYTTARKEIIEVLRNKGRPYLFSNSVSPSIVGASIEVFNMLGESSSLLDNLRVNTKAFRIGMKAAGFNIMGNDDCPIVPVLLGCAKVGGHFAEELMKLNIYVISFSYPVVPLGAARIRCQISSAHSPEQIDQTIAAFIKVGKELNVIQ